MAGNFLKLNRHGTLFYFRRRVPDDLRGILGQAYLTQSLRTGLRSVAIPTARLLAAKSDRLFDELRTMSEKNSKPIEVLALEWKLKHAVNEVREQFETDLAEEKAKHRKELAILRSKAREVVSRAYVRASNKPPVEPRECGLLYSEAMAEYLAGQRKATTRNTYKGRLEHAQTFFGADKDIRHIEQADFSEYASRANEEISNSVTAGHHITTLGGMLNHYRITRGWGAELTTKRLIKKKETPDSADRDPFSVEQLKALILNAAKYRADEPHKYWVTVAMPFLGCRIEELAQIDLRTDLVQMKGGGIWYLDINAKPDQDGVVRKSLKNKASWRCVPIHSAIVQSGFVDYLLGQREKGFSRPFESGWSPAKFDNGASLKWSHYITNWAGRELKKLIKVRAVANPTQKLAYFHSMRHTFSGCMGRAKIGAEISEAAMGHAYAGAERERYHKLKSDPEQLARCGIEPGLVELAALLQTN